mmetsp:Transcript_34415/g.44199  ORF Transcript_34415/g.44199 Transcript_34415/m.44199 type:complete len:224 (-) Transcript_34415:344-1015(-)
MLGRLPASHSLGHLPQNPLQQISLPPHPGGRPGCPLSCPALFAPDKAPPDSPQGCQYNSVAGRRTIKLGMCIPPVQPSHIPCGSRRRRPGCPATGPGDTPSQPPDGCRGSRTGAPSCNLHTGALHARPSNTPPPRPTAACPEWEQLSSAQWCMRPPWCAGSLAPRDAWPGAGTVNPLTLVLVSHLRSRRAPEDCSGIVPHCLGGCHRPPHPRSVFYDGSAVSH